MNKIAGFYKLSDERDHYDYFTIDAPTDKCQLAIDEDHIYFLDDIDDEIFMILPREKYKLAMDVTHLCICEKEERTYPPHTLYLKRVDIMKVLPPWYTDGDLIDKNAYNDMDPELHDGYLDNPSNTMIVHVEKDHLALIDTTSGTVFFDSDAHPDINWVISKSKNTITLNRYDGNNVTKLFKIEPIEIYDDPDRNQVPTAFYDELPYASKGEFPYDGPFMPY